MQRFACAVLILISCGGDDTAQGPVATFHPSANMTVLDVPYPSDLYLKDGHVNVAGIPPRAAADPNGVARLVTALDTETGFGATTGVFFGYRGTAIDPQSLTDDSAFLVRLSDGSKVPVQRHARDDDHTIVVMPRFGEVLLQGEKYAAVLTTAVKDTSGHALRADSGFNLSLFPDLGSWLDAHGVARGSVAAATVYTVHPVTRVIEQLRADVSTGPIPTAQPSAQFNYLTTARLDELLGTARPHSHIAAVVNGTYSSPYYLADAPTHLGQFSFGADGRPKRKAMVDVPFTLVVPAGTSLSNLRVVVFTHGINAQRSDIFWFADDFCARGYAIIGIDIPYHGNRQISDGTRDRIHNFTNADGPDGFAEPTPSASAAEFLNLFGDSTQPALDPRAGRDAFRQAYADLMNEARLVAEGDWTAVRALAPSLANLTFAADKLIYTSHSFGSMIGAAMMTVEPRYQAAVLVVGGGGLLFPLMGNSPVYGPQFEPPLMGYFGIDQAHRDPILQPGQFLLEYALYQQVIELGDPLAYAPYLLVHPLAGQPQKHVLLLEAIDDESVPNHANEALARGLGLPLILHSQSPARGVTHVDPLPTMMAPLAGNLGGVTAGLLQFDPATHGMYLISSDERHYQPNWPPLERLSQPTEVQEPTPAERKMALQFTDTFYAGTAAPQVIDPFAP